MVIPDYVCRAHGVEPGRLTIYDSGPSVADEMARVHFYGALVYSVSMAVIGIGFVALWLVG